MQRTIQFHPVSAALGALAIILAFVLTSQTTPPAQTTWPPPKSMIVNVFEEDMSNALAVIPFGGHHVVLSAPPDRWLTVTAAHNHSGNGRLRWAELTAGGVLSVKGVASSTEPSPVYSPGAADGPVGWTFAPGSSVVLLNNMPNTGTSAEGIYRYSLIGYYSRN